MGGAARIEMRDRVGSVHIHTQLRLVLSLPPPALPLPRVRGCVRARDPSSEFDSWMRLVISESSCVTYSRVTCVCVYSRVRGRRSLFTHALPQTDKGRASDGSRHFRRRAGTQNAGRERFRICPLATFYDWVHVCMRTLCTWHAEVDFATRGRIPCNATKGSRVSLVTL